jgi:hypothetical protein
MEGFLCTGMEGVPAKASLVGKEIANTFKEACVNFYDKHPERKELFNSERLTEWGCKLFDNEVEAKKFLG